MHELVRYLKLSTMLSYLKMFIEIEILTRG